MTSPKGMARPRRDGLGDRRPQRLRNAQSTTREVSSNDFYQPYQLSREAAVLAKDALHLKLAF